MDVVHYSALVGESMGKGLIYDRGIGVMSHDLKMCMDHPDRLPFVPRIRCCVLFYDRFY